MSRLCYVDVGGMCQGFCWFVIYSEKTSMVEFGKSLDPDEEYDVLLNILDFPIECVEGDEVAADWDISNAQFLGPIPSSVLMGPPMAPNEEFNAPNLFPQPAAPAHVRFYNCFCIMNNGELRVHYSY